MLLAGGPWGLRVVQSWRLVRSRRRHAFNAHVAATCLPAAEYGYSGRGRRLDPTLSYDDPFAALRQANQATDPAESAWAA